MKQKSKKKPSSASKKTAPVAKKKTKPVAKTSSVKKTAPKAKTQDKAKAKKAPTKKSAPKKAVKKPVAKKAAPKPAKKTQKVIKSKKAAPSAKSAKPTKPTKSAEPVKPTKSAKPAKAEKPPKPEKAPKPPNEPKAKKSVNRPTYEEITPKPAPVIPKMVGVSTPPPKPKREPIDLVTTSKTPRQSRYRMPAEWEPHYGTFITWPHEKGISFPGKGSYEAVMPAFHSMIRGLITSEKIFVNVGDEEYRQIILGDLTIAEQRHVIFIDQPTMEPWCRDHGCTFLVKNDDRSGGIVTWKFNGWGNKYDAKVDAQHSMNMARYIGGKHFDPGIVLEGGAIEVNGTGTVLTTESCLLNKNRNRGLKRDDMEKILKEYLNVTNVLWLPGGIEGDDTDGHIDTITRFVSRNTVVTCVSDDPKDKNYAILQKNLELLQNMKIEDGTPLEVIPLPMPQPMIRKGQRLPATYANFYIANKIVLLPTYDDPADEKVLEIMVKLFPTRRIFPIDCRELIWGLGAFHCLTQQVPLAKYPRVIDLVRNPPPAPRPVYDY